MTIKRKDFQKAAALLHEFLLKLSFDQECSELRDALNLALLHMQRYYRVLRTRMQNIDKNNGSVMAQSIRGLSPMTPFKDAPDKFQWKWFNLDSSKAAHNMPADVHKDLTALPPIILAAKQGNNGYIMELIEDDTECIFEADGLGRTALFYAVHSGQLDTLQILLENGIDINGTAHDGSTAAHRACHDGNHEALQILISYGANLEVGDTLGRYPVHWACATTNRDCLRLLVGQKVNVNVRDKEGMSPSMWACRMDHIEHFELLSQAEQHIEEEDQFERDISGKTWMHWSVRRTEPLECLKTLLTEDAADLRDEDGKSVIHTAAEQGSTASAKVIIEIAGKDCLEHRDKDERTPLILAAFGGHGEIINFLLSEGSDPNAVDSNGATAWDYARAKQLHYCMLIIASYIRQKAKEEEDQYGPLGETGDFGFTGSMDVTMNGMNSLQINGDSEQLFYGNMPVAPPQPPSQPRTPRTPRGPTTPRGAPTTPRGKAVNGWGSMPPTPSDRGHQESVRDLPSTPRGHAGVKRLTSGSDSNGEYGDGDHYDRGRKREGSAGKRRKNEHQTPDRMSVHSVHSSTEFATDRYEHFDGEPEMNAESEYLDGSDDNAEQEKSVSIAAMDVSDFEGGGGEGDDEHTGDDLEHDDQNGHENNEQEYYQQQQQQNQPTSPRKGQYNGNRRSPPPSASSAGSGGGGYSNHNGHPLPSQNHKPHRGYSSSSNNSRHASSSQQNAQHSQPSNYHNSHNRDPQYRDHDDDNYDDEEDDRPIPSPRQKSPPFSPNFQPAPLSQHPPPAHLQPLPPPSPGRRKKKKKKRESQNEPQLAPVAGPVPPPRGGSGYQSMSPPGSASSSHHHLNNHHHPSPKGREMSPMRNERGGSGAQMSIAQEAERYAQQKAALTSQGHSGLSLTGSRSNGLKPPPKKHVSSFDHDRSNHYEHVDSHYEHNYNYGNGDGSINNRVDPGRPPAMPKPKPRSRSQKLHPIVNNDTYNESDESYDSRRQYDDFHERDSSATRRSNPGHGSAGQQRVGSAGQRIGSSLPNGDLPRDQSSHRHDRGSYLQNGPLSRQGGGGKQSTTTQPLGQPPSPRGRKPGKKGTTPPINQRQTPNGRLPPTY